jgi:hypothetical protein
MITLINRQRIRASERRADKFTQEGYKLTSTLMLLDEFARLGKIEAIEGALATLRSKSVTICLIIQSIAQLDKIYGVPSRRIILDNCPYKAILNVSDPDSQKYFSMLSGSSEIEKKSYSISYDPDSGIEVGNNDTYNMNREPIVYPHEFAKLKDVVLMTPEGFCRVEKEPYYNQREQTPLTQPTTKLTDFGIAKRVGDFINGKIEKIEKKAKALLKLDNENVGAIKVSKIPYFVYTLLHLFTFFNPVPLGSTKIAIAIKDVLKSVDKIPISDKDLIHQLKQARRSLYALKFSYTINGRWAKEFQLEDRYENDIVQELTSAYGLIELIHGNTEITIDGIVYTKKEVLVKANRHLNNVIEIYGKVVKFYSVME